MLKLNAAAFDHRSLNEKIRQSGEPVEITGCLGQRFIAAGLGEKKLELSGTPGNALGAYLNGAEITVFGNAQDAVGDTMNSGKIVVHGSIGDAAGYAMRGGAIYVRGSAGYRAGIHMKEYAEKRPVMVIGGCCGSFLGEYQAGGTIIVLGLDSGGRSIVGGFPCTGMHGGRMLLRGSCKDVCFPPNVCVSPADEEDMKQAEEYISEFCALFGVDRQLVLSSPFTKIVPDSSNPYKQMYVAN